MSQPIGFGPSVVNGIPLLPYLDETKGGGPFALWNDDATALLKPDGSTVSIGSAVAYGAVEGGATDNAAAFQAMLSATGGLVIPAGIWRLESTIALPAKAVVRGYGPGSVVLWAGGDAPVFAQAEYQDVNAVGPSYICLRDFVIDDYTTTPTRTNHWTIDLSNGESHVVDGVEILGYSAAAAAQLAGILLGRHPSGSVSNTDAWQHHVVRCIFRRAKLYLNTSDSIISKNVFYGRNRDYCVKMWGGNIVTDNLISGAPGYPQLICANTGTDTTVPGIKLIGNHFDSAVTETSATNAVVCPAHDAVGWIVIGNNFRKYTGSAVLLQSAGHCVIANNSFRHGDDGNGGEPDIDVTGEGNVIGPNVHQRDATNQDGTITRTVFGLPIRVAHATVDGGTGKPNRVVPGAVWDALRAYASASFEVSAGWRHAEIMRVIDDFDAATLLWTANTGTDPQCLVAVGTANQGGVCVLTSGNDAGATMALNGAQIVRGTSWRCGGTSRGIYEFRVSLGRITDICVFAGVTDSTALEMPFTMSGASLTPNASDATGFLVDSAATSATVKCVGVKQDVDATTIDSGVTPTVDQYMRLRMETQQNGSMRFFVDDAYIGEMANAIRSTVGVTPTVAVFARNATSVAVRVDYILAESAREA